MKTKLQHWLVPLILSAFAANTFCLHATTFTVATTNISGPGSLPVTIIQANSTPGRNQIKISVTNVITLGLPLPVITNSVAISGVEAGPGVISGGGTLPLFTFAAGTTNSLANLVLANASTTGNGAAISNSSTLSVNSCIITNNSADNGSGGAIINSGVMAITASVISGNQAGIINSGGAIMNSGDMAITSCVISGNQAGTNGFGGAITSSGNLEISLASHRVQNAGMTPHFPKEFSMFWRNPTKTV